MVFFLANSPPFGRACIPMLTRVVSQNTSGLLEKIVSGPNRGRLEHPCSRPSSASSIKHFSTRNTNGNNSNKRVPGRSGTTNGNGRGSKSPDPVFDEFHNIYFESKPKSKSSSAKAYSSQKTGSRGASNRSAGPSNDPFVKAKSATGRAADSFDFDPSNSWRKSTAGSKSGRGDGSKTSNAESATGGGASKSSKKAKRKGGGPHVSYEELLFEYSYALDDDGSDEDEDDGYSAWRAAKVSQNKRDSGSSPGAKTEFRRDFREWFESYSSSYQDPRASEGSSSSAHQRSGAGTSSSSGGSSWRDEAFRSQRREHVTLEELLHAFRAKNGGGGGFNEYGSNFDARSFNEKFYKAYGASTSGGGGSSSSSSSSYGSSGFGGYGGYSSSSASSMGYVSPEVAAHLTVLGLSVQGGKVVFQGEGGTAPSWSKMDEGFLKRAFHARAMEWHPDRHTCPDGKAKAEERFKQLQGAYDALKQKLQARARA